MNRDIQEQMDNIQAGNMDGYLEFPDPYFECASVCVKNSTGEVVGILGGRNYANGGQLLLNHATEQFKQPGSTMKPILDYALAFENLGWATDHVLTDKPMYYDDVSKIIVQNDSGTYVGDVTLKQAVGQSINTCAIQTLQAVLDAKKYEYVVNYAQSLGYNFTLEDFDVQYAIGGTTCEVTPYRHAAAYAAIMNYGVYNEPHTITRIEFTNGKSPITPTYSAKQVLSEAASFLTTELMLSNVEYYGGTYSLVKSDDYTVYGKTGTTDYGVSGVDFGIPSGAIKDGWLVAATSEYTTATWVGYEKAAKDQQSYITKDYYYNERPQGKIAHLILDAAFQYGESKPTKLEKPSGVTSITHIIGTWPYAAFTEGMDESLRTTGLIKSDSVKLVSLAQPTIENMSSDYKVELNVSGTSGIVTITWPEYPDKSKLEESSDVKDISLRSSSGEVILAASGKCLFDFTKLYGPIKYMADVKVSGSSSSNEHIAVSENKHSVSINVRPGDKVSVDVYYGYEKGSITSNKGNFSKEAEISFPTSGSYSDIQSWCNNIGNVDFKEEATYNTKLVGTFEITSNGNNIQPGTKVDPNSRYVITFYTSKEHSVTLNTSHSSNNNIIVSALIDDDSSFESWSYDGLPDEIQATEDYDPNLKQNRVTFVITNSEKSGSFDVTAKSNNASSTITLSYSNGSFN